MQEKIQNKHQKPKTERKRVILETRPTGTTSRDLHFTNQPHTLKEITPRWEEM